VPRPEWIATNGSIALLTAVTTVLAEPEAAVGDRARPDAAAAAHTADSEATQVPGHPAPTPTDTAPSDGADADARAKQLYLDGDARYAEGDYEGARQRFEEAYRLSGRPALLFNIANALERMGRYEEALFHLRQYRASAPAELRERVDKRIAYLEERIARSEPATDPRPDPDPAASAGVNPQADTEPSAILETSPRDHTWRTVGYGLAGVGVAGLVVGTVFALDFDSAKKDASGQCATSEGSTLCPEAARNALARQDDRALWADVTLGAGALLLGVGAYLVIDDATSERPTAVRVSAGPLGGSLEVVGRF
jgi:tetratricopeptide (TPR) repeat protein